jgi:hypothetical protein
MPHQHVWALDDHDIELVHEEIEDLSDLVDAWTLDLVRRSPRRPRTRLIPFEDDKTQVWPRRSLRLGRG